MAVSLFVYTLMNCSQRQVKYRCFLINYLTVITEEPHRYQWLWPPNRVYLARDRFNSLTCWVIWSCHDTKTIELEGMDSSMGANNGFCILMICLHPLFFFRNGWRFYKKFIIYFNDSAVKERVLNFLWFFLPGFLATFHSDSLVSWIPSTALPPLKVLTMSETEMKDGIFLWRIQLWQHRML